jgi:hypothetical protein
MSEQSFLSVYCVYSVKVAPVLRISRTDEFLTAVNKQIAFWDVAVYGLMHHYQRFGRIYCFHLQGRRVYRVWYP